MQARGVFKEYSVVFQFPLPSSSFPLYILVATVPANISFLSFGESGLVFSISGNEKQDHLRWM